MFVCLAPKEIIFVRSSIQIHCFKIGQAMSEVINFLPEQNFPFNVSENINVIQHYPNTDLMIHKSGPRSVSKYYYWYPYTSYL